MGMEQPATTSTTNRLQANFLVSILILENCRKTSKTWEYQEHLGNLMKVSSI